MASDGAQIGDSWRQAPAIHPDLKTIGSGLQQNVVECEAIRFFWNRNETEEKPRIQERQCHFKGVTTSNQTSFSCF
jgi:hypothetical protein